MADKRIVDNLADQWTHGVDAAYGRLCAAIENGYRLDARDRQAVAVMLRAYERRETNGVTPPKDT